MRLILVRHAESVANAAGANQGWGNGGLTALGRKQALRLARRLAKEPIDVIYASDLRRVQETLAPLRRLRPDIKVVTTPALREQSLGVYEGSGYGTMKAAAEREGSPYFLFKVQGGETIPQMHSRVRKLLRRALRTHREGTLCFYCHGGPVSAIALELLKRPEREYQEWYPGNAHYHAFILKGAKARCLRRDAAP